MVRSASQVLVLRFNLIAQKVTFALLQLQMTQCLTILVIKDFSVYHQQVKELRRRTIVLKPTIVLLVQVSTITRVTRIIMTIGAQMLPQDVQGAQVMILVTLK